MWSPEGTGEFIDASGTIVEMGTGISNGIRAINNYTFSGSLTGPNLPTPEPSTFTLLGSCLLSTVTLWHRRKRTLSSPA